MRRGERSRARLPTLALPFASCRTSTLPAAGREGGEVQGGVVWQAEEAEEAAEAEEEEAAAEAEEVGEAEAAGSESVAAA